MVVPETEATVPTNSDARVRGAVIYVSEPVGHVPLIKPTGSVEMVVCPNAIDAIAKIVRKRIEAILFGFIPEGICRGIF